LSAISAVFFLRRPGSICSSGALSNRQSLIETAAAAGASEAEPAAFTEKAVRLLSGSKNLRSKSDRTIILKFFSLLARAPAMIALAPDLLPWST